MSKKELQLPVIIVLKALKEITDHEAYNMIVRGRAAFSEVSDRVEVMVSVAKQRAIYT
jgi:DNA-directed RNA polymerase I subunit RPA2